MNSSWHFGVCFNFCWKLRASTEAERKKSDIKGKNGRGYQNNAYSTHILFTSREVCIEKNFTQDREHSITLRWNKAICFPLKETCCGLLYVQGIGSTIKQSSNYSKSWSENTTRTKTTTFTFSCSLLSLFGFAKSFNRLTLLSMVSFVFESHKHFIT